MTYDNSTASTDAAHACAVCATVRSMSMAPRATTRAVALLVLVAAGAACGKSPGGSLPHEEAGVGGPAAGGNGGTNHADANARDGDGRLSGGGAAPEDSLNGGAGGAPSEDAGGESAGSGRAGAFSDASSGSEGRRDAEASGSDTSRDARTGVDGGVPAAPWSWVGIVGTGQSLAVGEQGAPATSTTQPYRNMKLATGNLPWPVDPNAATLAMVPLTEPIGRPAPTYPSSWPTNISGETPHTSMGNQITALVLAASGADYVSVHGEFGENGQGITFLRKGATQVGVNGHAFAATLIETRAITRLARAAGKTYGIAAITVTHGESDAGSVTYEADLYRLWSDYNADLPAITGQTQKIQMIISQQNSTNDRAASTLAQWKIGVNHPTDVVCAGPKYQYNYAADGIHLVTDGYRQLGEKYGQVYFERVVLGRDWQPLQPTTVERSGRVITVHYHVPVPPLTWESTFQAPHQGIAEWMAGKGFEVRAGNARIAIASVAIAGDAVQISCGVDLPATGVTVGYALTGDPATMKTPFAGTLRWGQLRDSDPFVGTTTKKPQPNFALAFELPVP
jgi:lysophospholipase L1-like esterase